MRQPYLDDFVEVLEHGVVLGGEGGPEVVLHAGDVVHHQLQAPRRQTCKGTTHLIAHLPLTTAIQLAMPAREPAHLIAHLPLIAAIQLARPARQPHTSLHTFHLLLQYN